VSTKILTLKSVEMRTSFTQKNLILRKFYTFGLDSDTGPNLFGSCSAPELDTDPNGHENEEPDPDPNKVGSESDPQHWFLGG